MTPDEVVNSLGNLSMALGVLDKVPQHLIKDALNNVIPQAISIIQDYTRMRDYAQECCTKSSKAEKDIQDYQKLRERVKLESCKYAVISHGIGISGEVEEIKVHCEMDSANDYTEQLAPINRNLFTATN